MTAPTQITHISQLDFSKVYSYADYLSWQIQDRIELIRGYIFKMSSPRRVHQRISHKLTLLMGTYFEKQDCEMYAAPFDVRFPSQENHLTQIYTVVQPDLCVICDASKLDEYGCVGAPDLVVEILSPSTAYKDIRHKYDLYEAEGVQEYWIVSPDEQRVYLHALGNDGKYNTAIEFTNGKLLISVVFPDLQIPLERIFEPDNANSNQQP